MAPGAGTAAEAGAGTAARAATAAGAAARPSRPWRLSRLLSLAPGRRHAVPLLALLLVGFAAPLLAVLWYSVLPPRSFELFQAPTLANYQTIFAETYYRSFLWSLGLAAVATASLAAICYPVAYGLARVFGRWANLVTLLLVLPLFVSENMRLYGWVLFFIKGGVLNGSLEHLFGIDFEIDLFTPPMIAFGMVYVYLPFMLFPMTLGLSMVPREIAEAAGDLGASRLQVFREVELPLAMPGMVIGGLLTFVLSVGAIAEAKVLGGQSVIVIGHSIETAFTFAQNWPLGAALSVLLMLVVGVLVLVVLRRFDLDRILGRR